LQVFISWNEDAATPNLGNPRAAYLLSKGGFTGDSALACFGPLKGHFMRDKTKVAAALSTLVTVASVAGRAKGW
jgi:hypothetical protein